MLLLLVGPSGAGKTAIMSLLMNHDHRLHRVRTYATRKPRRKESDRVAVSDEEFRELSRSGAFAWETRLFDTAYGTLADDAQAALQHRERVYLLDFALSELHKIEAQAGWKSAVLILPPSGEALADRLALAGRPERITVALEQYEQCKALLQTGLPALFDSNPIIVNEDLRTSVLQVQQIIKRLQNEDE